MSVGPDMPGTEYTLFLICRTKEDNIDKEHKVFIQQHIPQPVAHTLQLATSTY